MILFEVVLSGVLVGGMYGLIALGLNLQYGIARMMNLAYGEALMGGAYTAFWFFMLWRIDPLASMLFSVPVAFCGNWLIYRYLLTPLIRRAAAAVRIRVPFAMPTRSANVRATRLSMYACSVKRLKRS